MQAGFPIARPATREIRHFHLFCGLGSGAAGFNDARVELGPLRANFVCIGGIDVDPSGVADFSRLTGVPGTLLDLFSFEQYVAFHGRLPPPGWREATPDDIRRAAGGRRPHILFLSAPCKGFSGLLPEGRSGSAKYQALNELTLRGVWLMLEAFKDDPPELVIFENVPRIATRGRQLLDQIIPLLRASSYATAETAHDCGEIGDLAQSRKRFLMVARHMPKVPGFLYEPPKHRLRGVGEVLGKLPLPGDRALGGPLHRIPELQWRTWVRLAFVEAGKDWRSLKRLRVTDGKLQDYQLVPERPYFGGAFGVLPWDRAAGTVAGETLPANGNFSVADPRFAGAEYQQYGVRRWNEHTGAISGQAYAGQGAYSVADPRFDGGDYTGLYGVKGWDQTAGTVTSQRSPGQGAFSVADPRHQGPEKFNNQYRVTPWEAANGAVTGAGGKGQCVADPRPPEGRHLSKYRVTRMDEPAGTVISASATGDGAFAVADPRCTWSDNAHRNKHRVHHYDGPAATVTGSTRPGSGALCVADPRPGLIREKGSAYATSGHYGVVPWSDPAGAVASATGHDNGKGSVADPRAMPAPDARLACLIIAEDGTWHRPFTTLELAALQSLFDVDAYEATGIPFLLEGDSDTAWRERIGNAVPRRSARAIAETMGRTLLLAWSGEGFALSALPIWVRPVAAAISLARSDDAGGLP